MTKTATALHLTDLQSIPNKQTTFICLVSCCGILCVYKTCRATNAAAAAVAAAWALAHFIGSVHFASSMRRLKTIDPVQFGTASASSPPVRPSHPFASRFDPQQHRRDETGGSYPYGHVTFKVDAIGPDSFVVMLHELRENTYTIRLSEEQRLLKAG